MSQRMSTQDFMSAVRQAGQSGLYTYGASLNADNTTVQITQTPKAGGVAVVLFPKVLWNAMGVSALTDASYPNTDTICIMGSNGAHVGSCQNFLNSLA